MYILNAFSLNMISAPAEISVREISAAEAAEAAKAGASAVGHPDTAAVFSTVLGVAVANHRANVALVKGDIAVVGQYRGPRLPEGATTLPAGATIQWLRVEIA